MKSLKPIRVFLILSCLMLTTPAASDEITVAIPNRIETMDPLRSEVIQERFLMPLVFETLFQVRNDGEFHPGIVKSWSFKKGSGRLVLEIQPDRNFEDGTPVTLSDVLGSLNELCSKGSKAAAAFFTLPDCGRSQSTFKKESEHSISVRIASSVNFALGNLAYGRALIYKRKGDKLLSSGRFKFEMNAHGGITLIPNPFAPKTDVPLPSKIFFSFVPEATLSSSASDKQFDVYAMYLSSPVKEAAESQYKTIVHSPFITQVMVLNSGAFPQNIAPRVRLFSRAVREADLASCMPWAYRANGIIPMGILGSRTVVPNNIPKPNSHKVVKPLFALTLHRHVEKRSECEEDIIIELGRQVGLDVKFSYSDRYHNLFQIFRDPKTQGFIELFSFSSKDPSNILRRFSDFDPDNLFHFKSPTIGKLLRTAWNSDSNAARKPLYAKIQDIVESQSSISPLYYVGHTVTIRRCIDLRGDGKWRNHPNPFYVFLEQEIGTKKCK